MPKLEVPLFVGGIYIIARLIGGESMIMDEKLKEISTKLIRSDKVDDIATLRRNLEMYVQDPDITIRDISEQSGVPIPTINNLLYKDKQGIRLSTVIALASASQVSIDELVGCPPLTKWTIYPLYAVTWKCTFKTQILRYGIFRNSRAYLYQR